MDAAWALLDTPTLRWIAPVRRLRDQLMIALFPRWPYRDDERGYLRVVPFFRNDRRYRLWGGRIGAAAGVDTDRTLGSAEADIDSTMRFGALMRLRAVHGSGGREDGTSGIVTGTYRLLQGSRSLVRIGLGGRWSTIPSYPGIGPCGSLSIEWFPRTPWTVHLQGDIGAVRTHGVAAGSIEIGGMMRAMELRLGFLWQSGNPEFHGPMCGLSYWF